MRFYRPIITIVFSLLVVSYSIGQKASDREWKIFQKGVEQYKTHNYNDAARNFDLVISRLPKNRLITANYLMLTKTRYKQNQYKESLQQCDIFIRKFPSSSYIDDIYYIMGNNYYRLGEFASAAASWFKVAELSNNEKFIAHALDLAEGAITYKLDHRDIDFLKREIKSSLERQIILVAEAKKYLKENDVYHAKQTLDQFFNEFNKNDQYYEKAQILLQNLDTGGEQVVRIAALLPLSGENFDVGTALYKGAEFSIKMFNKNSDIKIELVPFDYESTLIRALEKIKTIAQDHSIAAIFGPLENDIAAACAAIIDYNKITMLTPTASDKSLTKITDYIVQLSSPVNTIAEALADFSADSLYGKRFVTLSPIDPYFKDLNEAFKNRLNEKGAILAAEESYSPGMKDFTQQFKKIKRIGLKLSFTDSVMSVDSTLAGFEIDSLYKLYQEEKYREYSESNTKIDSADIPVTAFKAFYMPIFQDDINMIAPQFAYYNFQCQILGNDDWYNLRELKRNKNYINGVVFTSAGYLNE
ncbi:penicillin-binding protein activator, partial [bacterium]|nr:penicillin-binding protein activator [bacterium]